MYGIINKTIQELVIEKFGENVWDDVLKKSGIDESYFLSTEIYKDDVTYKLAIAVSEVAKIDLQDVLFTLGEYWILKTAIEKYSHIIDAGGNSFREFLENIPYLHNRIALMFPKIAAPDFKVLNEEENSICIQYYSPRPGLKNFVCGQLNALSQYFNEETNIEIVKSRDDGFDYDMYKISWLK